MDFPGHCRYCGLPVRNKQGKWGLACAGCKGSLTRMLRSGKHGPTYAKATRERLWRMRYDPVSSKWVGEFEKDWRAYDWHGDHTSRDEQGRPAEELG